jgi:tRNA nucleotidyltransferase (CCA-adding enzyme)
MFNRHFILFRRGDRIVACETKGQPDRIVFEGQTYKWRAYEHFNHQTTYDAKICGFDIPCAMDAESEKALRTFAKGAINATYGDQVFDDFTVVLAKNCGGLETDGCMGLFANIYVSDSNDVMMVIPDEIESGWNVGTLAFPLEREDVPIAITDQPQIKPDFIPAELEKILAETPELKQSYLVGGCVRDALLGHAGKDFDVEVFGVNYDALAQALSKYGRTDLVGRSFGVVKLTTGSEHTYDFAIPRRDSKVAPGHKGFTVEFDPSITPKDAAARRDFTINAIMFDPRTRQVLDFFGGQFDLKSRILRHTSEAFTEDPLRVLRGMQFIARFDLTPAAETLKLCREISHHHGQLAPERVREEWFKWAGKSTVPSAGLKFLVATDWIDHYPELKACINTPQEPEWHPEGDVFIHTCHCCDALVRLPQWQQEDEPSRIAHMLAILAHDFGKPQTTRREMKDGVMRITSPGHDELGGELARTFMERINVPIAIQERVVPLVRNHLFHFQTITDRGVRRLAKRLEPENIESLALIMTADSSGRPPRPPKVPENVTALLEKAHELEVRKKPPQPILMGRHLMELGMQPGKKFGEILHAAYDAQLEGAFFNLPGALEWLKTYDVTKPDAAD